MAPLTQSRPSRPEPVRPTYARVDLAALVQNGRELRRLLVEAAREEGRAPPPRVLAVVKADAYGHGAVPVAHALEAAAEELGIAFFGVALVEEGVELRAAGVTLPILVLGGAYHGEGYHLLQAHRLTPVVFRVDQVEGLARTVDPTGEPFAVHLKLDTGMGRIGALPDELPEVLAAFARHPALRVDGLLSHFANADHADEEVTRGQLALFERMAAEVRAAGHAPRWVHLANSAATLGWTRSVAAHSLVRPGLLLYGYPPSQAVERGAQLSPVLSWRTRIVHLKAVPPGFKVSYGQTWETARPSVIATLPVGYADGFDRRNSNSGEVLVRGHRCPVVGRVCMDLCMIDVTDVPEVQMGDEVVLLGAQGDEVIGADTLAARLGTIPYEVLCGIDDRVPRIHVGG